MRGRSRVILLLARLFACIFLGSAVFRFVRGLVDDPNLNEAQGFVGWSFAFLLLVVSPPRPEGSVRARAASPPVDAERTREAGILTCHRLWPRRRFPGYGFGFERGEWATTLVGAPLAALVYFVWVFCFVFVLASSLLLYGIGSGGGYYGDGGGGGDGGG